MVNYCTEVEPLVIFLLNCQLFILSSVTYPRIICVSVLVRYRI
jgi:hypothetical protein